MNAALPGHTASKPIAAAPALLTVDRVSLEYRTARTLGLRQVDLAQGRRRLHSAL